MVARHRASRNASTSMFGIENGLCEKSIFFSSSFHSYIGKSTIQQNSKWSLSMRFELLADLGARGTGELHELRPACRRRRTPRRRRRGRADRAIAWCAPGRCSWRAGRRRPPRPRARRCSRGPAGLRPAPMNSCGRRRRGCRRPCAGIAHTSAFGSSARMLAKILKPEPRNASLTFCISIGLRRSGLSEPYFAHRLRIRDQRKLRRHRLAVGELLEHAAHHRLDRVEHVLLRDEAHLEIELVELAGRTVGARVLVAEARRDLEVAVEARRP